MSNTREEATSKFLSTYDVTSKIGLGLGWMIHCLEEKVDMECFGGVLHDKTQSVESHRQLHRHAWRTSGLGCVSKATANTRTCNATPCRLILHNVARISSPHCLWVIS